MAGLQIVTAAGQQWKIEPRVGDLTTVSAGLSTTLGSFSVEISADGKGGITALSFEAPTGTAGDVVLPGTTSGSLTSSVGQTVALSSGTAQGVPGGSWKLSSAAPSQRSWVGIVRRLCTYYMNYAC